MEGEKTLRICRACGHNAYYERRPNAELRCPVCSIKTDPMATPTDAQHHALADFTRPCTIS